MQAERDEVSTRDEVLGTLREWLVARRPGVEALHIDEDTDLIETRLLDSFQLVELILLLEDMTGAPILSEDLNPADLRTLRAIHARFFEVEGA